MHIQTLQSSPRAHRGGQVSHLLLSKGQFGSNNLAITWVEGAPGSQQPLHAHPHSEQVFVVVRGRGQMKVDDEIQEVGPGGLVFIPPGARHAIQNVGEDPLVFISATTPPFELPPAGSPFAYAAP